LRHAISIAMGGVEARFWWVCPPFAFGSIRAGDRGRNGRIEALGTCIADVDRGDLAAAITRDNGHKAAHLGRFAVALWSSVAQPDETAPRACKDLPQSWIWSLCAIG
jgi:hypothetical protein